MKYLGFIQGLKSTKVKNICKLLEVEISSSQANILTIVNKVILETKNNLNYNLINDLMKENANSEEINKEE